MTMTCSPKVLNEEQEEMTLEEAREFAQMERDRIDLEYDMTHQ